MVLNMVVTVAEDAVWSEAYGYLVTLFSPSAYPQSFIRRCLIGRPFDPVVADIVDGRIQFYSHSYPGLVKKGSRVRVDIEPIRELKVRRDLASQTASTVTLLHNSTTVIAAKLQCDDVRSALNVSGVSDQDIQTMMTTEENESLLSVIASRLLNRGHCLRRPDQITVIHIPPTELALWKDQFSIRLPSIRPYFASRY
jgi:hypothetical protein